MPVVGFVFSQVKDEEECKRVRNRCALMQDIV